MVLAPKPSPGRCPEIGHGDCEVLDTDDPAVFAHWMESDHGSVVAVHNLATRRPTSSSVSTPNLWDCSVTRPPRGDESDEKGEEPAAGEWRLELGRYDYCWVRSDGGT